VEYYPGQDLLLVGIIGELVAAALRLPAKVIGDGAATIRQLIEKQSRRRSSATSGESTIPLDKETERCIAQAGYAMDDCLASGVELAVRKTANLHTGGTIVDVTAQVHRRLIEAAIRAASAIDIPVTGIDLMVKDPTEPDYVFIEANERPGLANHEPQPTAERFIDLLFPRSMTMPERQLQQKASAMTETPPLTIDVDYLQDQLKALLEIASTTGFTDNVLRYHSKKQDALEFPF
jgi:D-alanine-D-alanine ligase-like ATP-grasp enzyme